MIGNGGTKKQPPLSGHIDPAFGAVRDRFAALLESGQETGAAVTVIHRGRVAVDLCGGWADAAGAHAWRPDTLVNTFSVSKAFAAVALLILVDRAAVGLDDRVADHWPEFAFGGKEEATVRHVLAHQAGLPAFPVPRAFDDVSDWDALTGDLADAAPEWPPGTAHGEHALTYGHLVGELVRRVDGRILGQFLQDEVARPWRLDCALGLDSEQQLRAAELEYADPGWVAAMLGAPGSLRQRALANPAGCLDVASLNGARWRSALMPAVSVHATAHACARLYAGLLAGGELDGVRLLSKATVVEMSRVQAEGPDRLLERHAAWGLGVQVDPSGEWGMGGIGGCDAFADPGRGYAYAYVTRRLADHQRSTALIDALNDCLQLL